MEAIKKSVMDWVGNEGRVQFDAEGNIKME